MKMFLVMLLVGTTLGMGLRAPKPDDAGKIAAVLDALHQAASKANGKRYFALFADDAVFFGTDVSERWPIDEFRRYAMARFDEGTGWTYEARERRVYLGPSGSTGWFDEVLYNAKYGTCRGTGVVVKRDGVWLIARYNLSIPIPNDIALDVVRMIRTAERGG